MNTTVPASADARSTPAGGRCLCGAVQYEVRGQLRDVVYCHCAMCRRSSGHIVAATACAKSELDVTSSDNLRWYQSSAIARRGFCGRCGSSLFWDPLDAGYMAIMAGTLDSPTGITSREHIFVGDAGDYYAICDGLPQSTAGGGAEDVACAGMDE